LLEIIVSDLRRKREPGNLKEILIFKKFWFPVFLIILILKEF